MHYRLHNFWHAGIGLMLGLFSITPTDAAEPVSYSKQIQPLLAKHCVLCHGPDEASAGLRLDLSESALAVLDSGERAILPGDPASSQLLARVSATEEAERMPPEGDPLSKAEIQLLHDWIANGAEYETHWAYLPVEKPAIPQVQSRDWAINSIDQFVLAKLEQAQVSPSPPADPAVLIKRVYYDVIGLPPTPAEVDAFVADPSLEAYTALIDRLLASEHFGERWGRHWLDMARYADSDGYEKDRPRLDAWRYRDWVIAAINQDLPYDQFTVEQLAGDLLPDATPEQKLATAFHRQTLTNTEGGTDQEEFRVEATFDRTETTAAIWMGLTFTCARCHTHKYDQITQREYYQLFAFFNATQETNTDIVRSQRELLQYQQAKAQHEATTRELQATYREAVEQLKPEIQAWAERLSSATSDVSGSAIPDDVTELPVLKVQTAAKTELKQQPDGSLLATGPHPDKETYTLTFAWPEFPLAGVVLEVLPDESLPGPGPGRTAHGNFVLNEVRLLSSADQSFKKSRRIPLSQATAGHAQQNFPASGAISAESKTGWAVQPQFGQPHHWIGYTPQPISPAPNEKFLQVVLDQQYGSKHTIGRFRLRFLTAYDEFRSLPTAVALAITVPSEQRNSEQVSAIENYFAQQHPEAARRQQAIDSHLAKAPASPYLSVRVLAQTKRETRLLERGDFLQPADPVEPAVLETLTPFHPLTARTSDAPPDRLDLARWLVDPQHPLTARVTVNHVWAYLFGRGLAPSINDFGVRGDQPTHPELLDWLAWTFPRDMQWSRKQLIRTILLSATYRQSAQHRPELSERDPTNLLLARQNRIRVQAEIVRDLHLSAAGLLSPKLGGPSVFPPLPPGVAELSYANNFKWVTSPGEDQYRRGMYTFFKRTAPHPTLMSFDCPDSNTTSLLREISNTPLQALVTLNNIVFSEAAQAMTARLFAEQPGSDTEKLTYALRICIARQPTSAELDRFQQLLSAARSYYQEHPAEAEMLIKQHPVAGLPPYENAAWTATLRMLLNLDEFIVRD